MTAARPRYYEFVLLALLVLLWGSVGLNRIGLGLIFPQIKAEFGMSNKEASLLIAGTSITWAFASWAGGWLSDRFGRRRVLLPAAAFICIMTAAMGIAGGFWSSSSSVTCSASATASAGRWARRRSARRWRPSAAG